MWPALAAGMMLAAGGLFWLAGQSLPAPGTRSPPAALLTFLAALALAAGVVIETWGHWESGLVPTESAYGAIVYMAPFLTGQVAAAVLIMAGFTVARLLTGRTDRERRNSFDHTAILAYYGVAQGLFGLLLVHGFPRVVG
jgi:cytochrome c oxidase subunit I+III